MANRPSAERPPLSSRANRRRPSNTSSDILPDDGGSGTACSAPIGPNGSNGSTGSTLGGGRHRSSNSRLKSSAATTTQSEAGAPGNGPRGEEGAGGGGGRERRGSRSKGQGQGQGQGQGYAESFPCLESIFSCYYEGLGTGDATDGWAAGGAARPGLQAIAKRTAVERTWRQYTVWKQVMRDYAAVFSSGDASRAAELALFKDDSMDDPEEPEPPNQGPSAENLVYDGNASALHFRVNCSSRPEVYNIVNDVLRVWPRPPAGEDQSVASEGTSESATHGPGTTESAAHSSSSLTTVTGATTANAASCAFYRRGEVPPAHWVELPTGLGLGTTWNLLWTWSKPRINYGSLLTWQRVNHFPRSRELTRKDLLKRNIQRLERLCASSKSQVGAFSIMPQTFVLPHEYNKFVEAFFKEERAIALEQGSAKAALQHFQDLQHLPAQPLDQAQVQAALAAAQATCPNYWILKPVGMSRGRGISLISDVGCVKYDTATVCQQYLRKPLLLDGYKFDLRLYILVTSFQPLEAWIYTEGFVRLATRRYDISKDKQDDLFVHLTNSSIQKHNPDNELNHRSFQTGSKAPGLPSLSEDQQQEDQPSSTVTSEMGGSKRSLAWLWHQLVATKILQPTPGSAGSMSGSSHADRVASSSSAEPATGTGAGEGKSSSSGGTGSGNIRWRRPETVEDMWRTIKEVVVKSLLCVDGPIPAQPNSFELFGYDVIFDSDLRPWLLEVRSWPYMHATSSLCRRPFFRLPPFRWEWDLLILMWLPHPPLPPCMAAWLHPYCR